MKPSRSVLLALLEPQGQQISYGEPDWQEHMQQELSSHYIARLCCSQEQLTECKQALLTILTMPVDLGFQLLYPTIERVTRNGLVWTIELSIREFTHA